MEDFLQQRNCTTTRFYSIVDNNTRAGKNMTGRGLVDIINMVTEFELFAGVMLQAANDGTWGF
jgi:hypothetical protein